MSRKVMQKAKGSFLPLLSLMLLGLAFTWVSTFTPGNLNAGDNLDMQPVEGGQIYDLRWDPRLFDPSGFIEWFHNPSLVPISQGAFETEIETAFNNWEAVGNLPGSPLVPVVNKGSTTTTADPLALDGINTVAWVQVDFFGGFLARAPCYFLTADTTTIDVGGDTRLPIDDMGGTIPFPGAPGVTYPPGTAVDCWMEFDALDSWSTAAGPVAGQYDVQAIATHEGGHWLGVSHSTVGLALPLNAETATMVPAGTSGNIDLRSLVEDDIASIIRTYARNSTPPGPQTVGGRAVIKFTLKKGATCEPATGVSVWAYETSGGLNGPNRVETFSGSQFRDPIGEPYNGSVKLNVSPGGPYTIHARTLEDNGTSSAGLYSAFRYSNTTINSNTMEPNALTQEFDELATVASIAAGNTVDLGTVGFLGCWIPVATSDVDIEMTASTAAATATLGGDIAVTSSFTNLGSAAAGPFEAGFYFSADATIDTDDAFTGFTCAIGGLGVGASDSCDGTVPVPAVAPGTYFVGALADIHNVIPENDELNNALAAPPQIVVSSDPLNPIVNPSFEDNGGSFHGWNIKELSRASNPQLPLTVVGPGYEYPAPSFTAGNWILDYFASQPTDGVFAAVHDFNGDDQGTLSTTLVNRRELYQDLTLTVGTTTLEFDYRAAWELYRFGATQDRTFGVEIQPAGGGGVLHAATILNATIGGEPPSGTGFEEDTDNPTGVGGPYPNGIVDLSAFAGQDVRLMFVWNVPEPGTGFAYFQLDNIRINLAPDPSAPLVTITAPPNGSNFSQGDSISFAGTATDAQDGDLTAGLSWSSDLDGSIGSGGAFSTSTLSAGTHQITASVTDSDSELGFDTITITVANVPPTVSISSPAEGALLTAGTSVLFAGAAIDPGDGDLSAALAWVSSLDGPLETGASFSAPLTVGAHTITASVIDSGGLLGSNVVNVTVQLASPPSLQWENLAVPNVGNTGWTSVVLSQSYTSAVAVCSPNYDGSAPPLVPRLQNAAGNSFDVRVDRADGSTTAVSGVTLHCAVVEEGVYSVAQHGIKMEAVKMTSTLTDHANSWVGQNRSYLNSYTNPVVVGQVMTYNDPNFSAFWARGIDTVSPPSSAALYVGKHVGEDPNVSRADETIGYMVVESGSGTISGVAYQAGVGADVVEGVGNAPPYNYGLSGLTTVSAAVVSQASKEGPDGGWAVLYGPNAVTTSGLALAIDEDQILDAERGHIAEQVAYLVFGAGPGPSAPLVTITAPPNGSNFSQGDSVSFAGTATDPEDGDLTAGLSWSSDLDGSIGSGGAFSTSTLSAGTHQITASVTDSDSELGFDTITITVANVPPTVSISSPAEGALLTAGTSVLFAGAAIDPGDGDLSAALAWVSSLDGPLETGASFSAPLTVGAHTITASVIDSGGLLGSNVVNVTVQLASPPSLQWENLAVPNVGNTGWTSVVLSQSYTSAVAVCSPNYDGSAPPLVPRLQNAAGNSFDVRVDRADGSTTAVSGVTLHCAVVEEGVYSVAQHGIKMEAVKMTSTLTDHANSWVGQNRSYLNSYTNPVVVGQVMTYNDPNFSAFWARGIDTVSPPSSAALYVGKHVGEDPNVSRADETIGYMVVESGSGTISGVAYQAGVGADVVEGVGNASPYNYGLSGLTTVSAAVVSQASKEGPDGGWAVLYGPNAVTTSGLALAIDEDQILDAERGHIAEQVAYLVFGAGPGPSAPLVTITAPPNGSNFSQGDSVSFAGTATDPEDGDLTAGLSWSSDLDGLIGSGGAFSTSTLSAGTHQITASVTDLDGKLGFDTITITVTNVPPTVSISSPAEGALLTAGASVSFAGAAIDPGDGDLSAALAWVSSLDGPLGTGASFSAPLTVGAHTITASVIDSGGLLGSNVVNVTVQLASPPSLQWENLAVPNVSNTGWTSVVLSQSYTSMVAVCSPNYDSSAPPLVPRLQNAAGNSFDVRVDRADGSTTAVSGVTLHCAVVEEGVYSVAQHGIKMEAVKMTSTLTDHANSWAGQNRGYLNTYSSPVVVGQVMTYNDPNFSAFWARGGDVLSPPSSGALYVGKHVGEDPNVSRADETIGYLVVESGSGAISGVAYQAGVGADVVEGVGNAPPYNYGLSGLTTVSAAVVSQASKEGPDGGWAVLYGPSAVTTSGLALAIDEDQILDAERGDITEQVAYLVFGTVAPVTDIAITSLGAPASTNEGDIEAVTVTVDNVGNQDVTNLSVSLTPTAGGGVVTNSPQTISLTAGASTILNYTWDTTGASIQDHTLTATHDLADDNAANDSAAAVVTVNGTPPPPTMVDNLANADFATAQGTITGGTSYVNTHQQEEVDGYEQLTEEQQGGNPSKARSLLDHTWGFNVAAGSSYVFEVDAFHSGTEDDFDFSYSRDNSTFTHMLTVTKTSDDDVEQMYMFPEDVAGTLYVRVQDTDSTRGTVQLDTLFVDSMVITTTMAGGGNTAPTVTLTAPTDGSNSDEGVQVTFTGTATDAEDGEISANLTWTSSLDGNLGTAASLPISTLSVGMHNITASLNDSGGLPGSDNVTVTINPVGGPGITLSASGFKVKGVHNVNLTWSGATSANVDVFRNGAVVATTPNDGAYTDNTGQKGSGSSYTYQVCEAGTSTCSNVATVNF